VSTLVIRYSSLGDVVLTGSVTGEMAPVSFLTSRRYKDIASALPGVEEVLCWEDKPDLRQRKFDQVIDLHASARSRWASLGLGARRVKRYDLKRRLRVGFKTAPAPAVMTRLGEAAGVTPSAPPWLQVDGPRDTLLLIPGTAKPTKCWAPERFREIARRWSDAGGRVLVLGSAKEAVLCQTVAAGQGDVLTEDGFGQTLAALGRGAVALGGDTGLTHLCVAAGIPAVVLFGPTTAQDGYWAHGGHPVSVALPCQPCSRHGGSTCPMKDHACMDLLGVDTVWAALQAQGTV